jgi:HEAT repeat protein
MRWRATGLVAAATAAAALGVAFGVAGAPSPAAAGDVAADADALVAQLLVGDAKASAAAADALVAAGASSVPKLVAAAATATVAARVVVLETLGRIAADHDEAVAPLVTALSDADAVVRAAAARGLCSAGPRAKPAAAALEKALRDEAPRVRVEAAAAFYRLGAAGPALGTLAALARDKDPATRVAALDAVAHARVPAANANPILVEALKDADSAVRVAAIGAASAVGAKDDAVAAAIAKCATSSDATERATATAALRAISDLPAAEWLKVGGPFRGDRIRRARARALGATPQVEKAVDAALDWLTRHQDKDGSWSSFQFDAHCKLNRCDGPGEASATTGVTGLALLAFLGAGETHGVGPHKEVVARALAYLRGVQGPDGRIGKGGGTTDLTHWTMRKPGEGLIGPSWTEKEPLDVGAYGHAVATVALVEAYMLSGDAEIGAAAKKAVDYVLAARNPDAAWRYACPPDGKSDTSITGWMCWALAAARAAGIYADKSAIEGAVAWIEQKTEPEFGKTGYRQIGGPAARHDGRELKFPADEVESTTSIGVALRLFAGRKPKDDQAIGKGVELILKKLPKWDVDRGTIDFYAWFWGATALRQVAGANWKTDLWGPRQGGVVWKKWSAAMNEALLASQRAEKDRDEHGSWDAEDAWSWVGGRVYATAMCCMALESYWRMDPVLDAK